MLPGASISKIISALLFLSATYKCDQDADDNENTFDTSRGKQEEDLRLLVLALVEDPNSESFMRFNQSVEAYQLNLTVVNLNSQRNPLRQAGDEQSPASSLLFKSLQKALAHYKDEQDLLVLLASDSSNLIVNGEAREIIHRFKKSKAQILFSADSTCWPDAGLESKYVADTKKTVAEAGEQKAPSSGHRFLDSRTLIGYATSLWRFLNDESLNRWQMKHLITADKTTSDHAKNNNNNNMFNYLQLFATLGYLDQQKRKSFGLELDHRAELFENLHSTYQDAELELQSDEAIVKNAAYSTQPLLVYGTGSSQVVINSLGNYLGRAWTRRAGCRNCNSTMISLKSTKDSDLPLVLIGVFINEPTPFLDHFFERLEALNYPKDRIHLLLYNAVEFHLKQVDHFWNQASVQQYASKQLLIGDESLRIKTKIPLATGQQIFTEPMGRDFALRRCKQLQCDYYLALDSVAHLDLADTLRLLIETNRTIVAPLLSRPRKLWSNFWASITTDGYYSRSHDYVELVGRDRLGIWNVPLVMNAYLIEGKFLRSSLELSQDNLGSNLRLTYMDNKFPSVKPALIFGRNLRHANVFQFVTNQREFGHLVDPTSFNTSLVNSDFYQLENNLIDWERKYLHEKYLQLLEPASGHLESPCQDVYWFPLVNEVFCRQLIEIMESFGIWSSGTNDDPRIEGGYESVPTRDIHFKQVGLHHMWLTFLREYVMPIQLKEYIGYEHDPPRTDLAFVVRYNPSEQASLRPHHDSSTYTLNIALNEPGVDYQGGGCRFVRYNCSVIASRRGWALIHPGRLTHYHEGLPVTNGTRYILVTFVDP